MDASSCVLIVDDDRNDIFLLRRSFHLAGLMTDFLDVPDGLLALEYLRGKPPYADRARFPFPNLLLLDIKMPRINGLEVLAWLSAHREMKTLPALVLTSSSLETDRQMAARLGAREFLVKPSDRSDWVKLARGLHERWLLARHKGADRTRRETATLEATHDRHEIADAAVRGGLFG